MFNMILISVGSLKRSNIKFYDYTLYAIESIFYRLITPVFHDNLTLCVNTNILQPRPKTRPFWKNQ